MWEGVERGGEAFVRDSVLLAMGGTVIFMLPGLFLYGESLMKYASTHESYFTAHG
jgi:hypothetical protein